VTQFRWQQTTQSTNCLLEMVGGEDEVTEEEAQDVAEEAEIGPAPLKGT